MEEDGDSLGKLVAHACTLGDVGTVKKIVMHFVGHLRRLIETKPAVVELACTPALEAMRTHGEAVGAEDWEVRKFFYDSKWAKSDVQGCILAFTRALAVPPKDQFYYNVALAENFLQAEDSGNADSFIMKAARCMSSSDDAATKLRYRVCRAKVQDARRNFQQAASLFYELSRDPLIVAMERTKLLADAATCVILERAGPQRQRLMGKIYKDSRSEGLPQHAMLEKMYREQLIRKEDVETFRALLADHQDARIEGTTTVLDRAVQEHNVAACSAVYRTIRLDSLARIINTSSTEDAEKVAASMIAADRLEAGIDQLKGILDFRQGARDTLATWDLELGGACAAINGTADAVEAAHPELAT